MKKTFLFFALFCVIVLINNTLKAEENANGKPVALADPSILYYNGMYYAYGTHSPDGIEVYTSPDLKFWKKQESLALHKNNSWADRWFWAPEVYYIKDKDKFYMYYSADEHVCVAVADSPLGPFIQDVKLPMIQDKKGIDNTLFIDDDGTPYMYFVRFTDGNEIWMVELEKDLITVKRKTLTYCFGVNEPWELEHSRVAEGAFVVKHKGMYYLSYSANHFESPFYGIGYAISDSPYGPWKKYEGNPILQKPADLVGVGHSAMFRDKEGQWKIVFHAHYNDEKISPRLMYIADVIFTDDEIPVMKISDDIIYPVLVE